MFNDTYEGEPEWNAEHCNAKIGDSTFSVCGWCEYRGSGSYRHDCMISGVCSLMKEYGEERNVKWDTSCRIKNLGTVDIESIIESKKWEIESFKQQIKSVEKEQKTLENLLTKAEWKPPLPGSRPAEYFNEGDRVWVWLTNKWEPGTVVIGYRHHDGCVSYVLDNFPLSQAGKKGPWGCGIAVPCILKDVELQYFKSRPEDFLTWTNLCDRSYNGEIMPMEAMRLALQNL